jgi:hypothetical protein
VGSTRLLSVGADEPPSLKATIESFPPHGESLPRYPLGYSLRFEMMNALAFLPASLVVAASDGPAG